MRNGFLLSLVGALTLSFKATGFAADHSEEDVKVRVAHDSPDAPEMMLF
ncbi:hypothetical protein RYX56_11960 [Alkalihalophilus lindianensis]|uniref:Uncharacterized protein n=1 Tax=Alkalihalophilus lindianensis TaxID=1630542 RepID=A0ABU3XB22_9BACI|nr:hypothetical protein [Alkalihalophilus lindianensis]MDV2685087.1 hypothetical protein [Alkalihalophilus lindianensis]